MSMPEEAVLWSLIIFLYQMQQAITFPNKLEKLTQKVTKLLSEKYKFGDSTEKEGQNHPMRDITIRPEDIQTAMHKTQKMNTKLKLIRTMLGYEYESSQKRQRSNTIDHPQQKQPEDKGGNLKQFVMSMRKRNELTDKYFKHRRGSSIEQINMHFDPQSKNILEYTDASLKYVHSFLPHHNTIEHSLQKNKKSIELISLTPQYDKHHSPQQNSQQCETIQNSHSDSIYINPTEMLQKRQNSFLKNRKSITINGSQNYNTPMPKRSLQQSKQVKMSVEVSLFVQTEKKQILNLPHVQNEGHIEHRELKLTNYTAPLDIYAHRVTDLIYRGKNYNRQLKNNLRSHRESKLMNSTEKQANKTIKELLPIIRPCLPEYRRKHGNIQSP